MHSHKRRLVLSASLAAAIPAVAKSQSAYPNKPIRLIVPFLKNGSTDIVARLVAPAVSAVLGQEIRVDNIAGAGGTLGAQALALSASDGYTLGMATVSTTGTGPIVRKSIKYDPINDFTPVHKTVDVPGVVCVHPSFPANDFPSFIAELKRNPGKYSYGSSGSGGVGHMAMELLKIRTGTYVLHIPYRSIRPAIQDVLDGRLQMIWDNLSSSLPHIQSGKMRAIGLVGEQRSRELPDLKTFAELGVKNYHATTYFGILAPGDTPASIVYTLNSAFNLVLDDPAVRDALYEVGAVPVGGSPDVLRNQIVGELSKWGEVARYTKVTIS